MESFKCDSVSHNKSTLCNWKKDSSSAHLLETGQQLTIASLNSCIFNLSDKQCLCCEISLNYRIAGKFGREKFGKFGESPMICQSKTIQISNYN